MKGKQRIALMIATLISAIGFGCASAACRDVSKTESPKNSVNEHVHTEVIDEAVAATCTQDGKTEGKHCAICGEVLVAQETIPAGHTAVIDEAVAATCTQDGKTEGKHCALCGEVLVAQETIPAGHMAVIDEAVAPTCTKPGKTEGKYCWYCGKVLVAQKTIPMTEHTIVIDEAVEPTCTETGKTEGKHCSVCGKVLVAQKTIPIRHIYQDGKCTMCGEREPSIGLKLQLNSDKNSYRIIGLGSCKDTEIIIPSTYNGKPVTSIGDHAFKYCSSLTSIVIPDSVINIGYYAFYYCSGLTSIVIPDSVTRIGYQAFYYCSRLTSIIIPDSVTSIEDEAFKGCGELESGLESITVSEGNTTYHSRGNCLIHTTYKKLVLGCKNSVIPADGSVISIGDSAFCECNGLTSIVIPDSVTSIGNYAFA